ncbi:MAG: hypothetical protein AUG51_00330 [Acidobacteria bacterium 13_1_20CM_3_53_8]|nr:MAG: hypothetical protein AUG51_00330 [Acidobacteria bacterium 13_1_20CM_3_53_8]
MARGLPGADSSGQVTAALVQAATNCFGETPKFWGRYFKSPTGGSFAEYRHKVEDPVLAAASIKLLPIAQQTAHVNGDEDQGASDAQLNVADILATFPKDILVSQGGQFLMFLDVEGVSDKAPSLSIDYYTGWANTLVDFSRSQTGGAVTLLPCVYARQLDNVTWNVLVKAVASGIPCHGAWVARYPKDAACTPIDFNNGLAIPQVKLPFDVLIWQYYENCLNGDIDLNQANPNINAEDEFLGKLILPPSAS